MTDINDLRMKVINHALDETIAKTDSAAYADRLRAQRSIAYELIRRLDLESQAESLKALAKERGMRLK